MKTSSVKNWLIDSLTIIGLTVVAVFLVPIVSALYGALLILVRPHAPLFRIAFVMVELIPYIVVGAVLGLVGGWLIRHRNIFIASLPAVLTSAFFALYFFAGPDPFPRTWTWFYLVIIGGWLLLIAASLVSAWFILRKRQLNKRNS